MAFNAAEAKFNEMTMKLMTILREFRKCFGNVSEDVRLHQGMMSHFGYDLQMGMGNLIFPSDFTCCLSLCSGRVRDCLSIKWILAPSIEIHFWSFECVTFVVSHHLRLVLLSAGTKTSEYFIYRTSFIEPVVDWHSSVKPN